MCVRAHTPHRHHTSCSNLNGRRIPTSASEVLRHHIAVRGMTGSVALIDLSEVTFVFSPVCVFRQIILCFRLLVYFLPSSDVKSFLNYYLVQHFKLFQGPNVLLQAELVSAGWRCEWAVTAVASQNCRVPVFQTF